jgi:clan AA aspartic protease
MMQGRVVQGRATIPIMFLLPEQPNFSIGFVIDTGFNDHLTLPQQAVNAMNLQLYSSMLARLADGREVLVPIHVATIIWNAEEKRVPVLATGIKPLLGTALLNEFKLIIDFVEDGLVSIEKV